MTIPALTPTTVTTPAPHNKSELLDESVVSPSGGAVDHVDKWDINDYLGATGDGCITGTVSFVVIVLYIVTQIRILKKLHLHVCILEPPLPLAAGVL